MDFQRLSADAQRYREIRQNWKIQSIGNKDISIISRYNINGPSPHQSRDITFQRQKKYQHSLDVGEVTSIEN